MNNQNFRLVSGDDIDLLVTVRASGSCDPADLTGASSALWVLADRRGCTPRLSIAATITDAANGLVTVTLAAADTADLRCGTYHHELQVRDSQNKTSTVMTGHMMLVGDSAP